ncbi:MAG: NAD(P)-dependent alcohol dehydrogenase [Pseudomonadota bacterium]
MKATAAVVREPGGPFIIEPVELEAPRDDEVLIRIKAVGMCHTDIAVCESHLPGPMPIILGHEGAGVVESVGARVSKVAPGDHVVMTFLSCGGCRNCVSGRQTYCDHIFVLNFSGARPDGSSPVRDASGDQIFARFFGQSSFATYALAAERNIVKAPKDVDFALLGPLGCGVLTGAGAVFNVLQPEPGASLAVFGVGAVGMSGLMAAKTLGVTKIIAVDIVPERLALARELGASHAIDAREEGDIVSRIQEITGRGADCALETTGNAKVFRQAVDSLAMPGICGFVGAAGPGEEVAFDMARLMTGRRVVGIIEGEANPDVLIPHLIDLIQAGVFPLDRLIKRYPLSAINEAVAASSSGEVIKPVLEP